MGIGGSAYFEELSDYEFFLWILFDDTNKTCIFARGNETVIMEQVQVLDHIKKVASQVLPKGSSLYLYGSRARGDSHEGSDWDLLLLLDKPRLEYEDFDRYSYPFVEMGWNIGEDIRPHAYTKDEWLNGPHSLFYYNVEEDKKVLL